MKITGLLVGLLMIVLVAGGALCPPDTDACVGGSLHALHAFIVIGAGVALSIPLIPEAYLRPSRPIVYRSFHPDPAAPPPRG